MPAVKFWFLHANWSRTTQLAAGPWKHGNYGENEGKGGGYRKMGEMEENRGKWRKEGGGGRNVYI